MSLGDDGKSTAANDGNEPTTGWLHKKPEKWTTTDLHEVTSSNGGYTKY
jgi:hypothetical protein